MREAFGVEYERVDFANPDTQGLIDAKINEASHGLIPSLNAKVDPLTRVLLTDILYFKAHWEIPFEEENTDELPFYGAKETVDVPTMCMEERLEAVREKLAKYGQEHLLKGYDKLDEKTKKILLNQIENMDFDLIQSLYNKIQVFVINIKF